MTDIVTPPTIDAMPPAPQPTDTREQFNLKAFPHAAAQQTLVTQANASAAATNQNAVAANERAVAASASASAASASAGTAGTKRDEAVAAATTATQQAGIATGAASTATTKRDEAVTAAGQAVPAASAAVAARDQAQIFATQQIKASSTTSVTPGAGNKTFAIETSRSFVAGMYLVATSAGVPGTRMSGYVSSYDMATGQLVLAVDSFAGSSARADWQIGVAAPGGGAGAGLLTVQRITANTSGVPNVHYVIGAAGIRLTIPSGMATDDRIAVSEDIAPGLGYEIDFGTVPLRGYQNGLTQVISNRAAVAWRNVGGTTGLI